MSSASTPRQLGASLLLVGDVDYSSDPGKPSPESLSRSAATSRGGLPHWAKLGATRDEIESIRRSFETVYQGRHADRLLGDSATEEGFRRSAPSHRYIHLATHGYFSQEGLGSTIKPPRGDRAEIDPLGGAGIVGYNPGLLSGLVLAGANRGSTGKNLDDGILTALEVAELDLSGVELAVLSACETGLGRSADGEGILGLQRAFHVAGARSVIASLWSVDDQATRDLMAGFYREFWRDGRPPAQALRTAQIEMIGHRRRVEKASRGEFLPSPKNDDRGQISPYFWAAFAFSTNSI